ncbi:MAG: AAA family ATPase [Bacteroidales bacterium]|nr:AAA family ATPase [Bacteroidales bacterium]
MKYPIGIQSFEKVREEGYTYVDKTGDIFKLASEGSYYFLSRPRRFGKSLLLSTMRAYFEGRRELFEGLAIAELEKDWVQYPVLYLDLNTREYTDKDSLIAELNKHLEQWESDYGDKYKDRAVEERLFHVIQNASHSTGKKVVILIDEYDKPLLQTFDNEPLQAEYRSMLKAFYGNLKSCDEFIRFAFLTGVTKFGKVSVFSDLNNLSDISLLPQYADICGITDEELRRTFAEPVKSLAANNGITEDECYTRLAEYFDGYHFYPGSVGVYNPFSLLSTLKNQVFRDYWFETGTPTILVNKLQHTNYNLDNICTDKVAVSVLNSIDVMDSHPLPLLFQSGYLTIKDYDTRFGKYTLGFPNRKVEEAFSKLITRHARSTTGQCGSNSFFCRRRTGEKKKLQ